MTLTGFAAQGADQIYQSGPETLAASSWAIAAGTITQYSKQIKSSSGGTDPIPLTWTVTGRLKDPLQLKGEASGNALAFSRDERSLFVPQDNSLPEWQLDYGDIEPGDSVVLFFQGDPASPNITVLPSGADSRDLIDLLHRILPVQSLEDPTLKMAAWLRLLEQHGSPDEVRKAALRSLIRANAAWPKLAGALEKVMAEPDPGVHTFVFGIVTFAEMNERFGDEQPQALDFLCRQFVSEKSPRIAMQYVLNIKLLLSYTSRKDEKERVPLQRRISEALKQRRSQAPLTAELAEQYKQIQAAYAGIL
jgi:hypothetical protein